jgi:hypothetical protein
MTDEQYTEQDTRETTNDKTSGGLSLVGGTMVTVVVTGLAFCKPIPATGLRGEMKVLFIHPDEEHVVTMKIETKIGTQVSSIVEETFEPGFRLRFTATDEMVTSTRHAPGNLINIFDLHGAANPVVMRTRTSVPPVKIARSLLTIPSSQFYSKSSTDLNHEFWLYNTMANTKSRIDRGASTRAVIGRELGVEFMIPAAKEMQLNLEFPAVKSYPLPTIPNTVHTVTFDNTCHQHSCGNDFGYYYEILNGSGMEIEEFPIRKAVTATPGQSLEAACNPIWGEPPCNFDTYAQSGSC